MNVTHLIVIFHNPSHLPTFPHPLIPHSSKDHSHQHGFRWQYRSHTSTWTLAAPQTEEAQSRKWTIFCLLYPVVARGQNNCAVGQHEPGQSLCKLQAAAHHAASPTSKDMHPCQPQLYPTPVAAVVTVSPVLPSFPPLHHTLVIKMPLPAHKTSFFFPKQLYIFTCKYLLQCVVGLIQGFWFLKFHKHCAVAEIHLRYHVVAQSWGNLAARPGVRGCWDPEVWCMRAPGHCTPLVLSADCPDGSPDVMIVLVAQRLCWKEWPWTGRGHTDVPLHFLCPHLTNNSIISDHYWSTDITSKFISTNLYLMFFS